MLAGIFELFNPKHERLARLLILFEAFKQPLLHLFLGLFRRHLRESCVYANGYASRLSRQYPGASKRNRPYLLRVSASTYGGDGYLLCDGLKTLHSPFPTSWQSD